MANSMAELCGTCCKGSHPMRKSFSESIVCACGAPFFSQIVVENNLPPNRRCLIEIPMEFMEDHGSRLDKTVALLGEEDNEMHRVMIGGNLFVGFGFEWRDFAQSYNIGVGQIIVFTLVARSRFLVQVYKLGNQRSAIAPKPPGTSTVGLEHARTVPPLVTPKVEDDDDIEVCVAQDWLKAKASRTNAENPILPSKVKEEKAFFENSSGQATGAPDNYGWVKVKERHKCSIAPRSENDVERMDVSDGIVETSDSSRRKKTYHSEVIHEGHSLQRSTRMPLRYEHHVLTTPAEVQGGQASPQASPRESSSDDEENGDSDASSASTSDPAWSPGKSHAYHVSRRRAAMYAAYGSSSTEDEDVEDVDDDDDEVAGNEVSNTIAGTKHSSADGSTSLDGVKRKRGRPRTMKIETDLADANEEMNGTKTGLLVEGSNVKRHFWNKAGTKRGRTYVSKRRPVTETEKLMTLERARLVQVSHPSFLKQLHKDSCYRSLILFSPTRFYRESMVSAPKGSYKATLIDEEGKSWPTRIKGMQIFWKNFTLDHYLEEDDVVVCELVDPRPESVKFLVHIFRVVDVKVTLTGKAGWADHYDVVEGTKKQYFEERRRMVQAHELDKLKKKMQKDKQKQKQKYKGGSLNANGEQLEDGCRPLWKRPTTRIRSRELNQSSGELNVTPCKSVGSVKQEVEDAPPLTSTRPGIGNAVNSVNSDFSILDDVFGGEESD